MSFHEVLFPTEISYGSEGGPSFSTTMVEVDSGHIERVSARADARHVYDVSKGIHNLEGFLSVREFYLARNGSVFGFRFRDPLDQFSSPISPSHHGAAGTADQACLPIAGQPTKFQLAKTYTSGPSSYTRTIKKPVAGTTRIWVSGVEQIGNWSIDDTTGVVTMNTTPAATPRASFQFDVPVIFDKSVDSGLMVSIDGWDAGSIKSIKMVEILDEESTHSGEFNYGGAVEKSISADVSLSMLVARFWVISATNTGRIVSLPNPSGIPDGGQQFFVKNGGSNSFTLKDHAGTTLATLTSNQIVEVLMSVDGSNNKVWHAT